MLKFILAYFQGMMQTARTEYGVDPVIFLVIYGVCVPFWYLGLFRTLRALAGRRRNEVMLWSAVFLAATVAPFVYVMAFGHNIPWWVYAVIAALIGEGVWSLVTKLRRPPTERDGK
jgi:hypothetical protein